MTLMMGLPFVSDRREIALAFVVEICGEKASEHKARSIDRPQSYCHITICLKISITLDKKKKKNEALFDEKKNHEEK